MTENAPLDRDYSVTLSEADRFAMTGLVLFGARWKAPLARTLGVSRETVSRWVSSGDVPKWAMNTAALLVEQSAATASSSRSSHAAWPSFQSERSKPSTSPISASVCYVYL
jgi:hypothetical protein